MLARPALPLPSAAPAPAPNATLAPTPAPALAPTPAPALPSRVVQHALLDPDSGNEERPSQPSAGLPLTAGARVQIQNLKQNLELNGLDGTVTSLSPLVILLDGKRKTVRGLKEKHVLVLEAAVLTTPADARADSSATAPHGWTPSSVASRLELP